MKRFSMCLSLLALVVTFTLVQRSDAQSDRDSVVVPGLLSVVTQPQPPAQEPHPLPPPDNKAGEQSDPKNQPPPESQQPDAGKVTTDSFTGTIAKIGNKFILQTATQANYQLDDQKKAKPFEGKHVKVFGTLDPATNLIYVSSIQPAS